MLSVLKSKRGVNDDIFITPTYSRISVTTTPGGGGGGVAAAVAKASTTVPLLLELLQLIPTTIL